MNCCTFSGSSEDQQHRIRKIPYFWTAALLFWLFWLWISRNVPYGIDDWQWGVSAGLEHLKTASLNSRYVGNALEVIVSRSKLLKTLLIGTMEALIPLLSVLLVQRWQEMQGVETADDRFPAFLLTMANLIWLTLPREVWAQTYGWVAGFSNYGLAAFLLVISQGILLEGENPAKKHSLGFLALSLVVGLMTQLVLESLTVFMVALGIFSLFVQLLTYRRCGVLTLAFLLGIVSGALIMFSGNIYRSLLTTGHTEGVGRELSFTPGMSLPEILQIFSFRFRYFMPGNLWGNNWLACSVIALCMIPAAQVCGKLLRMAITGTSCGFAFFFIWNHFLGPIEKYVSRWNEYYTQWLHILFFVVILVLVLCLFRREKNLCLVLLLLWILCPLAISPMLAVSDMGGRCFLPPLVFFEEFCLLLLQREAREFPPPMRRIGTALLAASLLISAVRLTVVFTALGKAERQREKLIDEARETHVSGLYLPDYPYGDYHWITEPLKGGGQIQFFREFYQIPDDMELLFDPAD